MALSVKLYRVVGKGKDRRYIPIDLGRRGRRSKEDVTGPFYLRYGLKYESVGIDFKAAVEAMQRRQATLDAVGSGVAVKQDGDPNRKRVVDEVRKFLGKKSLLKDPKTVKTYTERLGYFLNTGCREQEVANAEYCDLLDDVNVVWVRSKPHRGFKLKGKRWQNKGRKLPVPTALMEKLASVFLKASVSSN